jgi:endo-1,4-beta-mannosidase
MSRRPATMSPSRSTNKVFTIEDRLSCEGSPFAAVGVNYHPATSGCELLSRWDPSRLEFDFREMSRRGCNTVRFFVLWREVEPVAGRYDELAIARLRELVSLAAAAGLACVPTLLTIFMNGELLDLPWRARRDIWTDPTMRLRAREYVGRLARELRQARNVLAYDLGDELMHIAPEVARELSPAQARSWLAELAAAVRENDPGALVMQANESSAVFGDHPFSVSNAEPLDLLGLHGFPLWSAPTIESTASPKATLLPAFLARFGSLFGQPLTDELGAYAASAEVAAGYLRAAGHSALANGSAGVLAWCWQDTLGDRAPYDVRPQERLVGLLDGAGNAKPAMAELELLAQRAQEWSPLRPPPAPVAVLLPELWRPRPGSYLEQPRPWALSAFYAFLLLKRAHLQMEFTDRPRPHHRLLICPSVEQLTIRDHEALANFVATGGVVLCSSGTVLHGLGEERLFGVRPHDFTLDVAKQASFEWNGVDFPIDWGPNARIPLLEAPDAEVLARYPNGHPALTRRRHGEGAAFYLNAPFERQLDIAGRLEGHDWHLLYDAVATEAGIDREADCDSPLVEIQILAGNGRRIAIAINHAPTPVTASLLLGSDGSGGCEAVELAPKAVETLCLEVDSASAPARG